MRLSENTVQYWNEASEKILKSRDYTIEIEMDKAMDNMLNLKYFLLIADRLYRTNRDAEFQKLSLVILPSGKSADNTPNKTRLVRFFSEWNRIPYIDIRIGTEKLPSVEWEVSRIFPICQAADIEEFSGAFRCISYKSLKESYYDSENQCNHPTAADVSDNYLIRYANKLLVWMQNSDNFQGTPERKLSNEEKKVLKEKMMEAVFCHLGNMNILAQVIWLYILRELIETKQLYGIADAQKENAESPQPSIYGNIISKSRMDAISYAEGLYQTIENACIYSEGKQAWFGIRMHRAGKQAPFRELKAEIHTRETLYEKYRNCFSTRNAETGKLSISNYNIFTQGDDYRFYFEFYVADNSSADTGIASTYNKKAGELEKKPIHHMGEIFNIKPSDSELQHIEDVTVHYGMRLLRHIIEVNHGYLMGVSPAPSGEAQKAQFYYGRNLSDEGDSAETLYTEWNAILPIYYQWNQDVIADEKALSEYNGKNCFGETVAAPPEKVLYVPEKTIFNYKNQTGKADEIRAINNNLNACLKKYVCREKVLLFHIGMANLSKIELFAKALFALIAEEAKESNKMSRLFLAVLMPNAEAIQEFIRFFSMFYYDGIQEDMEHTQIALCRLAQSDPCVSPEKNFGIVEFILVGKKISSVMETARLFAYHNAEDSLEHLPMLGYLTDYAGSKDTMGGGSGAQAQDAMLFPFDLFLPGNLQTECKNAQMLTVNLYESWFVNRMSDIINSDLREKGYGCKIKNIHMRLGSKIHIDSFYEAELLFHNTGNIARFAYYVAVNLLHGDERLQNGGNVLILGYEKYSAILIMQIKHLLEQSGNFEGIYSAIVHDDDEGEVSLRTYFDKEIFPGRNGYAVQVVTVLPVGTTLSTIYKMHNAARRELKWYDKSIDHKTGSEHNFCLVLVNSDLKEAPGGCSSITKKFWSEASKAHEHLIDVSRENHDTGSCKVRYLIAAFSKWYDPKDCSLCKAVGKGNKPLIDAKHAETMPSAIFTLYGPGHMGCDRAMDNKQKRIACLLHHISYSHIYSGNNHFQFFHDFQGLYYQNKQDIDKDLRNFPIDRTAFNIVVSPLHIDNSAFVKSVLDNVFKGCARFFHFDILDAYREEIRSKFSYIARDYRLLKQSNPNAGFRIYFVDNSIVTGENLNRARLLLRMLISQEAADTDMQRMVLFDKIFLFINRCHDDTLRSFVRDVKADVYSYIHLDIPSYNTSNDFCPACRTQNKYVLMGKRSSTINLNAEFVRLGRKHDKRSFRDYHMWQEEIIMNSNSYFSWLLQWLHVNVSENKILTYVPEEEMLGYDDISTIDKIPEKLHKTYFGHIKNVLDPIKRYLGEKVPPINEIDNQEEMQGKKQQYMHEFERISLSDVMNDIGTDGAQKDNFKKSAIKLVKEQIIEIRDYMRLYSLQTAYIKLNSVEITGSMCENPCRSAMLELIAAKMYSFKEKDNEITKQINKQIQNLSGTQKERFILGHNVEWLISYVKVISREQLAYYHDYRQAIVGIIEDMLTVLYGGANHRKKAEEMKKENAAWGGIMDTILKLVDEKAVVVDNVRICTQFYYQLYMTLVHRLADLQVTLWVNADGTLKIISVYNKLQKRFFREELKKEGVEFICLPSMDKLMIRYLKAVKVATMTSNDANPCLMLAGALEELRNRKEDVPPEMRNMLTQCIRLLYLENTQMMYVGMRCLDRLLTNDILNAKENDKYALLKFREPLYRFEEYMAMVKKLVQKHLLNSYSNVDNDAKEEDLLRQNVLYNFCCFWYRSTRESPVSQHSNEAHKIAYMLQYFRRLNKLSEEKLTPENKDLLPYEYEELCRCICGFTGFAMCYMVYFSDEECPRIFAQSGYNVEMLKNDQILTLDKMEEILSGIKLLETKHQGIFESKCQEGIGCIIANNIYMVGNGDGRFLVLGLKAPDDEEKDISLYVVMQNKEAADGAEDEWTKDAALRKARDILFMRQTLQEILQRDYALLINYRYDCSYVRPISPDKASSPSILHISDLHILEDSEEWIQNADAAISKAVEKTGLEQGVDLLIVTGDIIDGKKSDAAAVEKRYRMAENLLRNIAIRLWQDESGYLPHDWKRRLIITTGNHDFASMNQYKPVMTHRMLNPAIPADRDGGTMSKFAYFIDFLVRFLDAPVDMLLKNDLNEVRQYRKLKLLVLALNCSSTATSRRVNKIGVNSEKLKLLLKKQIWCESGDRYFRICAAHYSPKYDLSYFLDNYDTIPGWEWRPELAGENQINKLVHAFCDAMVKELENYLTKGKSDIANVREEMKGLIKSLDDTLDALEKSRGGNLFGDACKFYQALTCNSTKPKKDIAAEVRENEIYKDIKYYGEWLNKEELDFTDERMSKLIHDISECEFMSKYDKQAFENDIDDICEVASIDLYLAGHIHAYAEYKEPNGSSNASDEEESGEQNKACHIVRHILVANRFHDGNNAEANGYLVKNIPINAPGNEAKIYRLNI